MSNISNFMQKIATDPEYLEKVKGDPHTHMDEAGLTADEKASVMSGDESKVKIHLTDDELQEAAGGWLDSSPAKDATNVVVVVMAP